VCVKCCNAQNCGFTDKVGNEEDNSTGWIDDDEGLNDELDDEYANDNGDTFAGSYGNGRFEASLTVLCTFYERHAYVCFVNSSTYNSMCCGYRFHASDIQFVKAKAFLALKYNSTETASNGSSIYYANSNNRPLTAVPPVVKQILKANESTLWILYTHYTNPDFMLPSVKEGSKAHRRKKVNTTIHFGSQV
jgi:hypothetical protein